MQFSISQRQLRTNVKRFRGGLVFQAHRLLYHSAPSLRVKSKKKIRLGCWAPAVIGTKLIDPITAVIGPQLIKPVTIKLISQSYAGGVAGHAAPSLRPATTNPYNASSWCPGGRNVDCVNKRDSHIGLPSKYDTYHTLSSDSTYMACHPNLTLNSASVLHFFRRLEVVLRVSSSLLGPVVPSFRALSGRLKFTVRRHKVAGASDVEPAHRQLVVSCATSHGSGVHVPS